MGYGATRTLERVAAAMGELGSAPVAFQPARDVPQGGVLLAVPALLATGVLRHTQAIYQLPQGFYGIESIFLLLALMALARIRSIEQLRYVAPGEWGKLLGLDRIPEVRTLRAKLALLCKDLGRAAHWSAELAKEWIAGQGSSELVFYVDGHVRVYHGDLTPLPRHYVARERLCLRATTDYWVNAMDGQPFLFINQEVDPGLVATLRDELVPWLKTNVPLTVEQQQRLAADPLAHRFTLVFDREGYSPELFLQMRQQRIAILTYHKYPGENWPEEEFAEHTVELTGGERTIMKLAERGTQMSNGLWVREIRRRTTNGHQTSILTTNYGVELSRLAVSMFARWTQENFFRYMREHYSLDRLIEYGTEPVPDTIRVVNPAWRKLDSQIRSQTGKRHQRLAQFGAQAMAGPLSEPEVDRYQQRQGQLQEEIDALTRHIEKLQQQRRQTNHHITVQQLPDEDQFTRLRTERKHFIDTIKMISYRAETSMVSLLRESLARSEDDTRALLRQIYNTEADLFPDAETKTLTVRLHHLTQSAHDRALQKLCDQLNATETLFPGTELQLVYKVGST
jgi:hypothetical protein